MIPEMGVTSLVAKMDKKVGPFGAAELLSGNYPTLLRRVGHPCPGDACELQVLRFAQNDNQSVIVSRRLR